MDDLNKGLMAFAACNAGAGQVETASPGGGKKGTQLDVWFGNVERIASGRKQGMGAKPSPTSATSTSYTSPIVSSSIGGRKQGGGKGRRREVPVNLRVLVLALVCGTAVSAQSLRNFPIDVESG